MDSLNLSRYANITIQRVEPPEEKLPIKTNGNEYSEDFSDKEDIGETKDLNKILEKPVLSSESCSSQDIQLSSIKSGMDAEPHITYDINTNEASKTVDDMKLEPESPIHESYNDEVSEDHTHEELESNSKRKSDKERDENVVLKKVKMTEEKSSDEDPENQMTSEKRLTNLRRNIREVMDETKLDEATLAAQRQEMERLRRVQEQQRLIREVQKQIAINKQSSKTQDRVKTLLQGGTTSLIKKPVIPTESNTIVISTDSGSSQDFNKKMLEYIKNQPEVIDNCNEPDKLTSIASKLLEASEPHMVTSSVSIAPVKPMKVAEIVTISSESEVDEPKQPQSSDDDCILISGDEEEEEVPDDDANNSGMHTNDAYNQPDDLGRILINVGHPENEPDVFLAPQIARIIKPHQIGGVRFMYDNVVESLERFKTSSGFGCILAHSMGLGKTLQVVSFCDVFLRHTPAKHVLCIMPINTLQNWLAEFNMWLPEETNNQTSENTIKNEDIIYRQFSLFVLNDFHKTISARGKVIQNWRNEGGVLLMGYELYRQLTTRKTRKKRNKKQIDEDLCDEKHKPLLDEIKEALVKPGPDLIICDEGHRIKNSHASTSQSLKEIESRRRIVLTGYPLQNNLLEYWCMVDFVRPNYLGSKTEFSNMFERPIQNGQCIDSTPQDIRLMRYRAHVLHSLLEGFVQRRSHSVLEKSLPQKEEYVLLVRLTPLQRLLYDRFMNEVVRKKAVPNPLKAFAVCCKIWNHPDILYFFLKKRSLDEAEIDLDLEEAGTPLGTPLGVTPTTSPSASKRSRNRSKGGGVNSNSKDLNVNRKNTNKDVSRMPAVATVMPNTSNNQISPTQNRNSLITIHSLQNNQVDDYSQNDYRTSRNIQNQQYQKYNHNNFWKDKRDFYQDNYHQRHNTEKNPQLHYSQDPTIEEREIRLDNNDCNHYNFVENNFRKSNDFYHNVINQNSDQINQTESSLKNQRFSKDSFNSNQDKFINTSTNHGTPSNLTPNFSGLQSNISISNQISETKNRYIDNHILSSNKSGKTNQVISNSNSHADTNCRDNVNKSVNLQVFHGVKDIVFGQEFNDEENQSNSNALFVNQQNNSYNNDGFFSDSLKNNNHNLKLKNIFNPSNTIKEEIYENSSLIKHVDGDNSNLSINFNELFDNNQVLINHQEINRKNQCLEKNSIQTNMSIQEVDNCSQSLINTLSQSPNHSCIDTSGMVDNNSILDNHKLSMHGLNNQKKISANSQNQNHAISHSHNENITFEQKFISEHQQQHNKQNIYQNSENQNYLTVNETFMSSSNSNLSYNNYNVIENNQNTSNINHNYGSLLSDQQFQNQNLLNDQMLQDQEILLANDQAMLSVLNSTTDVNEQALLYNAMVGQSDGHSILGLLDSNMMSNQNNSYEQPVYGPLPSNIKPGLPGGMKTDPDNQYFIDPKIQQSLGRGVSVIPLANKQNDKKSFTDHYNVSKLPEPYKRFNSYSSVYPYASSSNTPLGSISDILDNIPVPECSYQPAERKNIVSCTMTSQDVSSLNTFHSLENKSAYGYSGVRSSQEIFQHKDEKSAQFPIDSKDFKPSDDAKELKTSTLLDDGEIKNPSLIIKSGKEEPGIPYDWAVELFKDYIPGMIEASAKMSLLFAIVEESIKIGDRVLLFSQSLFTLDLIEDFLQRNKIPGKNENWCRNYDYYRLDGSTSASEREKLINDFNKCNSVHLFLVSTRAGSLGINLVGANRVIVFDASWNPCHDTQAVCRVYRYGQKKPCFVYRLVTDNCLEKKIYDRQINKQVMADRVVDECNPDAHLSIKEVTNLCWDDGESKPSKDFSSLKDNYDDLVMKYIVENFSSVLTKEPFQHESLFVDRKDKKLSQAEKRLAKRSYEMEKKAISRPMYSYYGQNTNTTMYRNQTGKPMASVRPMQSMSNTSTTLASRHNLNRKWIPAEVWQKQGMSAQEMTLPLDVVIPTNAGDRGSIVLKAGQKVMVLKSPKGIYMQLESGKIIAIRTSANSKPNSPLYPGQNFLQQTSLIQQTSNSNFIRSQSIDTNYNLTPKNDNYIQQLRNRSNLLRNNPNISLTPKQITPTNKPLHFPAYSTNSHQIVANSQSLQPKMPFAYQQPKLPSAITVTKYDPLNSKPTQIGLSSKTPDPYYNPRQPSEYSRSFDKYQYSNISELPSRLPLPQFSNNVYSSQNTSTLQSQYHHPSQ